MPGWLWALRWTIGGRLILLGMRMLPHSAPRSSMCAHVKEWSAEWGQRMRDEKARKLAEDMKRTAQSWQETSPMLKEKS